MQIAATLETTLHRVKTSNEDYSKAVELDELIELVRHKITDALGTQERLDARKLGRQTVTSKET